MSSEKSRGHKNRGEGCSAATFFAPPINGRAPLVVAFDRKELSTILTIYGHGVANGAWRDYAIDHLKDGAVFSIFRRASEMPLYRIEKRPKLAKRQGAYALLTASGQILKRGSDLSQIIRILNKKLIRAVG